MPRAAVPAELLEFRLEDWSQEPLVDGFTEALAWQIGGDALHELSIRRTRGSEAEKGVQRAFHRWGRARHAWATAHGWPGGDIIDQLCEELEVRRAYRASRREEERS